jgi:hypothetical protein
MSGNSNLHDSSRNKQDEFYTNLQLIEDELKHYRAHFKGKRVLCNCDDPYESNFFKYFAMNFNALGLKSLTATCYAASPFAQMELNLFGNGFNAESQSRRVRRGKHKASYKIVITEVKDKNGDGRVDLADVEWLIKNKKNVLTKLPRDDEDVGDITNQRGIYEYVLDGDERHLSIRKFSDKMARTAYERQKGICPVCGKHYEIEEMQVDHTIPWSKGGRTIAENCQMLCVDCNLRKGDRS